MADQVCMSSLLGRLFRKTTGRSGTLRTEVRETASDDAETLEAALADAEELAARTNALARDLHRLLARGIARRRAARAAERILH